MNLDLSLLPVGFMHLFSFGIGVIIGSFLNVYIYRFHTGKSLSGNSHCLSCGTNLKWYELFPLFSYLALRGRCRSCGCKIPPRYFLVELLTGVLFVLATNLTNSVEILVFWWIALAILVIIFVYDIYHFIIPDSLTLSLTLLVILRIGYKYYHGYQLEFISWDIFAALCGSVFLLSLWLVSKGQWLGFGDVKLVFPLGLMVGAGSVFSFVVLSFWIGAGISLLIIFSLYLLRRGKQSLHLSAEALTMKSAVPFAPFLIASCLVILFTNFNVLAIFSF